jgi:hypothetical protein
MVSAWRSRRRSSIRRTLWTRRTMTLSSSEPSAGAADVFVRSFTKSVMTDAVSTTT